MKRSELIKNIAKTIANTCGNDGEERLYPSDEFLADSILRSIEEVGMLPPKREIRVDNAINRPWWYEGHEWEDEDEEK